jgi:threonine dehydrogenase-like Zn-dependent dehydrogenase
MKALCFENRLSRLLALKAAQCFSRHAALGPFSTLRYADVPEPELPGPRWLKIRNIACGLCGTDLHFMYMDMAPSSFPAAMPGIRKKFLGHELVGEVVECGTEVEGPAPGDRVVMRIDWPSCFQLETDPPCSQCAAGNYMLCEKTGKKNLPLEDTGGGFSPYMVMHRSQPFSMPETLSNDHAVLIEPLASAVHGVLKAPPEPGEKVLVIGGGTIGLLTLAVLRARYPGADVHCLARYPFQARVAEAYGARVIPEGRDLHARMAEAAQARHVKGYFGNEILLGGFDVIYDTAGSDASLNNALRWARGGGRVVLVGINFAPRHIDYTPIWCQEVQLFGINCHATEQDGRTSFAHAAQILLEGHIEPGDLITHRFPLAQYRQAVRTFLNKKESGAIKIVLEHREG